MYNPKLKSRLHRIRVPALFLWGEDDRFAPPEYGKAYSALIPGARFELVSESGHFPHIEQAERVARRIVEEMK
jgi:pimeloyl-ACP methyl ester carboxylesterase